MEGDGKITARNMIWNAETIDVDAAGLITSDGKGLQFGDGAGTTYGGGSYGGRGGMGSSASCK